MNLRSQLSILLRKINLLPAAEKARFYWHKIRYKKDNDAFRTAHPNFVFPPEPFIYETYRLNYRWYYDDGKNTAAEIISLLSKHIDLNYPGVRILDWGCGPARISRHFPDLLPRAAIYGTDYNKKYIKWCNEHLDGIFFSVNNIDPPTGYSANFFDSVIGLSVFTHLSDKGHSDWIDELYRIVKPGKFVYITTQGQAYYSKLTSREKKLFNTDRLVVRDYLDEGNRLYSSFQPQGFTKKLVEGKFRVVEMIPGKARQNEPVQDIWLLQKL